MLKSVVYAELICHSFDEASAFMALPQLFSRFFVRFGIDMLTHEYFINISVCPSIRFILPSARIIGEVSGDEPGFMSPSRRERLLLRPCALAAYLFSIFYGFRDAGDIARPLSYRDDATLCVSSSQHSRVKAFSVAA